MTILESTRRGKTFSSLTALIALSLTACGFVVDPGLDPVPLQTTDLSAKPSGPSAPSSRSGSDLTVFVTNRAKTKRLFAPAKTGKLVPCDGEAHSNGFQDRCGVCAPRWGIVEEREPVTLDTL